MITVKRYYAPEPILRHGCPARLTPICKVSFQPEGERRKIIYDYATMVLLHKNKKNELKSELPLESVHHNLAMHALHLHMSGASNILLCQMSFDCLMEDAFGNQFRDYVTFDLKIPGTGTNLDSVFSYEFIRDKYGSKANLYQALRHFYQFGRARANPNFNKHGHVPDYDPNDSKHDQYIRHTEQFLVAYLSLPEAAQMLYNRLKTEIRGKYPHVTAIKTYNMGLHMHSTKTCCSPCEYSLLALMNDRIGFIQNNRTISFLHNFEQACLEPNDQVMFSLPRHSPFRVIVTVSTNETDQHHQKYPAYASRILNKREQVPTFPISVKSNEASSHIFTAILDSEYDQRKLSPESNFSDLTVAISGSKATSGSPGTMNKVRNVRKKEYDETAKQIAFLEINDLNERNG